MPNGKNEIVLILHDIRSVENVGSIFRTADAAGVSKIYLAGYTPAPLDRFGRKRRDMAKVSLGAEETVLWEQSADIFSLIKHLKEEGYAVVAVEQDARAVSCGKISQQEKIVFVFGNEVGGLPQDVLKQCNIVAEIPMFGKKESLNVAIAAGIMLFLYKDRELRNSSSS
ncbi:MAG: TrmH family RNA methyltransferase [Parcubacteria group bacterium]|nr:TrmH family RNA methyltransferase [Parcubacteria group bacterium]